MDKIFLSILKYLLLEAPGAQLIELAQAYINLFPDAVEDLTREQVPDWVLILDAGSSAQWKAVVETALADMKFEEAENAKLANP